MEFGSISTIVIRQTRSRCGARTAVVGQICQGVGAGAEEAVEARARERERERERERRA